MKTTRGGVPTLLFPLLLAAAPPVAGQSPWPDRAENLQELPADFDAARLRAVMTGFTRALGVRCSYCHVGEEGAPLSTYEFASDANPAKDRARAMLRLLGSVNDSLRAMDLRDDVERVNMWCHTCHAGKPRPQTLSEAVGEVYRADGGPAALARFLELRAEHYGGPAYDFRPPSVNALASELFNAGDTATAAAFFRLNVDHHPDYAEGWESLGDLAAARGDGPEALRMYERALALAPEHPRLRRKVEEARGG